jgi:hypothetical protein
VPFEFERIGQYFEAANVNADVSGRITTGMYLGDWTVKALPRRPWDAAETRSGRTSSSASGLGRTGRPPPAGGRQQSSSNTSPPSETRLNCSSRCYWTLSRPSIDPPSAVLKVRRRAPGIGTTAALGDPGSVATRGASVVRGAPPPFGLAGASTGWSLSGPPCWCARIPCDP